MTRPFDFLCLWGGRRLNVIDIRIPCGAWPFDEWIITQQKNRWSAKRKGSDCGTAEKPLKTICIVVFTTILDVVSVLRPPATNPLLCCTTAGRLTELGNVTLALYVIKNCRRAGLVHQMPHPVLLEAIKTINIWLVCRTKLPVSALSVHPSLQLLFCCIMVEKQHYQTTCSRSLTASSLVYCQPETEITYSFGPNNGINFYGRQHFFAALRISTDMTMSTNSHDGNE